MSLGVKRGNQNTHLSQHPSIKHRKILSSSKGAFRYARLPLWKNVRKSDTQPSLCGASLPKARGPSLNRSSHGWQARAWYFKMKSSQAIGLLPLSLRRQTQTQSQHTDICCDGGSTGYWVAPRGHLARLGAQGRLPDEPRPELSPNKKQDCLGNSTKNKSGEEAAATAERQGGVSQCGSLVELRSCWVRLPSTHYTSIFPFLPWEALILTWFPTAMNKGLNANQNWTGSYEMKNLQMDTF